MVQIYVYKIGFSCVLFTKNWGKKLPAPNQQGLESDTDSKCFLSFFQNMLSSLADDPVNNLKWEMLFVAFNYCDFCMNWDLSSTP
jgi:hypothetical protein